MSDAAHPHTAHESSSAVIHYRHHPFHGEPAEIIRRLRRSTSDCLVIKLRDEVQVAVPSWMLDPVCCQQLTDEAQPRIAVAALRALRALVDSQSWLTLPRVVETSRDAPRATGGDDARPPRASTDATDPDVRPSRGLAGTPGSRTAPMPRLDRPIVARRPTERGLDKESR